MIKNIYILTACRNAAGTIETTFSSIISQKDSNSDADFFLHYHVQDGASTDGTIAILEKWAKKFEAIPWCSFSYTSEADAGMYEGISKGFKALNITEPEAYMGWINADDRLLPSCLATVARIAQELPKIRWIGGTWTTIDVQGNVLARSGKQWFPQEFIRDGLCDCSYWPVLQQEGIFWKKSLWDDVGGIDTTFRLAGDWDLWRRMARHAAYVHVAFPMGAFCRREGQLSSSGYLDEILQYMPYKQRNALAQKHLLTLFFHPEKMNVLQVVCEPCGLKMSKPMPQILKRKLCFALSVFGFTKFVKFYNAVKIYFRKK